MFDVREQEEIKFERGYETLKIQWDVLGVFDFCKETIFLQRRDDAAYANHAIKHNKSIPRHIIVKFWNIEV